ncbi:inositol monophosphatase [bacterium]|nr:inositol monophosphatase [bacterium]
MTAASIFISSQFDPDDAQIVSRICNLLTSCGILPEHSTYSLGFPDRIVPIIQQHELYCAVLTTKSSEKMLADVSFEIKSALSSKRKVIVFRDIQVPVQGDYPEKVQIVYHSTALLKTKNDDFSELTDHVKELLTLYGINYCDAPIDGEILKRYDFAREQAQVLGSAILRYYNDVFYPNLIKNKAAKNFPTSADITANRIIRYEIDKDPEFCRDTVISEEDAKDPSTLGKLLDQSEFDSDFTWVIDPLDGTLNFAYNFPYFCVSIGVLKRSEPVIGIVFNPTTQELYCGLKGKRSECIDLRSGQKRYLNTDFVKRNLEDCIVMTHLSTKEKPRVTTINILDNIMRRCRNVRMLGSGQMSLVSIALGQFDIFFNYSTNIWDVIPGAVILSGAGGYATTSLVEDTAWDLHSQGILAACNANIGKQIKELLLKDLGGDFPRL